MTDKPVAAALARGPRGLQGLAPEHEIDGGRIRFRNPDRTWGAWINTLGIEGPSGDAQNFSTRALAIAHNITPGVASVRINGYAATGDRGAAWFQNVPDLLTAAGFTSADGQKWEVSDKPLKLQHFGNVEAKQITGTVASAGANVTGVGTKFTTELHAGDKITFYPVPVAGAGWITSQPIDGNGLGTEPWAGMISGFGGVDFIALGIQPGDTINPSVYGGFGALLPKGKSWAVNTVINAIRLRTVHMPDPHFGAGSGFPYVIVAGNVGYVYFPYPHGKIAGNSVVLANTGNASLNGIYTVQSIHTFGVTVSNSMSLTINTSGVPDGTYAAAQLQADSDTLGAFVVTSDGSGIATARCPHPHGLSVGDEVRTSGYGPGVPQLDDVTQTVLGVVDPNHPEYPRLFTFSAPALPAGIYQGAARICGVAWSWTPHAEERVVQSVTDDTHLVLTAPTSRNFAAGASVWTSPDAYPAFRNAVTAAKLFGCSIRVEGRFYLNNLAGATLDENGVPTTDGRIVVYDFHHGLEFAADGEFILKQTELANGFLFKNGSPRLIGFDASILHPTRWSANVGGSFPYIVDMFGCHAPIVIGMQSKASRGQALDLEFCYHPTVIGVDIENCSGGISIDNNIGGVFSNINIKDCADEAFSCYGAEFGNVEDGTALISNVNIRNAFHGMVITGVNAHAVENIICESVIGASLNIGGSINPAVNTIAVRPARHNRVSGMLIRNAGTLGPATARAGQLAAVMIHDVEDCELSDVHVRDSQSGHGFLIDRGSYAGGTIVAPSKINMVNCSARGIPQLGLYAISIPELNVRQFVAADCGDMGILFNGGRPRVRDAVIMRCAKSLDGASYGPHQAIRFHGCDSFDADDITLIDDQATPTGFIIGETATVDAGRLTRVYSRFTPGTALLYDINSNAKVFVEQHSGASVGSAASIMPTGQIFQVSGTAAISTIVVPAGAKVGDKITLLPTGLFTFVSGGGGPTNNIRANGSAVVNRALDMTWDGSTWWPSYVS
jgi:hypothetical protein